MIVRIHFAIGLIFALLLAIPMPQEAQANDDVTLEEIWAAFRARQQRVETVKVTWKYRLTKSASSVERTLTSTGHDAEESADMTSAEVIARLSIAGDRVRYETMIPSFVDGNGGDFVSDITAFDGEEEQSLTGVRPGDDGPQSGTLEKRKAFRQWGQIHLAPLVVAFRPCRQERFGPDPGDWKIIERPVVIDGRECVMLEKRTTGQQSEQAYLDRAADLRMLRYTFMNGARLILQIDARYEAEGPHAWVPISWTSALYSGASLALSESSQNELLSVVLNEPMADEHFRIKFPPRTEVSRIYTPYDTQEFVAQEDGSLVPTSPRRRLPQPTPETPWWRAPWLLVTAGVLVLALIVGYALWRRKFV